MVTLIFFINQFPSPGEYNPNNIWKFSGIFALIFIAWWCQYAMSPSVVDTTYVLTSSAVDGVDMISDKGNLINLNLKFGKHIEPGTKVGVTTYKKSYMTDVHIYCLNDGKGTKYTILNNEK
jgi:hypothetical protein